MIYRLSYSEVIKLTYGSSSLFSDGVRVTWWVPRINVLDPIKGVYLTADHYAATDHYSFGRRPRGLTLQSVTPSLSLGGEAFWLGSQQKSGVGLAARHVSNSCVATAQVATTGLLSATYVQKVGTFGYFANRVLMMMMSISPFGPVGCGRPLSWARRQRHTTAHNLPCIEAFCQSYTLSQSTQTQQESLALFSFHPSIIIHPVLSRLADWRPLSRACTPPPFRLPKFASNLKSFTVVPNANSVGCNASYLLLMNL
jgi:hypothetical protein